MLQWPGLPPRSVIGRAQLLALLSEAGTDDGQQRTRAVPTTSVAIADPCAGLPWVHARVCCGMPAANRRAAQTQDGRHVPSRQRSKPKRVPVRLPRTLRPVQMDARSSGVRKKEATCGGAVALRA